MPGAHPLFDPQAVAAALDAALAGAADARDIRARAVAWLTEARAAARADLVAGLDSHPRKGRETVRALADLTDATVRAVHHVATTHLHPNLAPTEGERLSVIAVGGYGRINALCCVTGCSPLVCDASEQVYRRILLQR